MSARMLFDLHNLSPIEDTEGQKANLAEACLAYFKVYGKKIFCFNDLQTFIEGLDSVTAQSFLKEVRLWCLREHERFFGQDQVRDLDDLHTVRLSCILVRRKILIR